MNPIQPTLDTSRVPANDNANWTANLWIAARMFAEFHRRYRMLDPSALSSVQRAYRAQILAWSIDALLLCWKQLSDE